MIEGMIEPAPGDLLTWQGTSDETGELLERVEAETDHAWYSAQHDGHMVTLKINRKGFNGNAQVKYRVATFRAARQIAESTEAELRDHANAASVQRG